MSGVSEALRLADLLRLQVAYHREVASDCDMRAEDTINWGHGEVCCRAADELLRLHAYCQELEAQVILDCMTHGQQSAEIEHVAGDVSKNGAESNMAQQPAPSEQQPFGWIKQSEIDSSNDFGGSINLWRRKYDCDVPVYLAQQPAPSAAAVEHGDGFMEAINEMDELHPFQAAPQTSSTPQADSRTAPVLDRARIREIFMAHGFTVKEGQTDLKQYVYDAADALLRAASAPADSVTAPAGGLGWKLVPMEITDAMRNAAAQAGMEALDLRDAGASNVGLIPKMYEAMLAASPTPPAQAADSVTAPAATPTAASIAWTALRDLTDPLGEAGVKIMGHVRIYAQRQYEAGLTEGRATPPAQAADSVLEDAELGRIAMRFVDRAGDPHPGIDDAETICREFHAAMSAVLDTRFQRRMDAARKQGANHD